MFVCDLSKREIIFFEGKELKKLTADFDLLLDKIQKKYQKLDNVFIGKGNLQIVKNKSSFFYSFLYNQRFEVLPNIVNDLGIKNILQYFYGYTIEENRQIDELGTVEIYGERGDLDIQIISSEKALIEKSFFVEIYFDQNAGLYIAYARFPLAWGNYTQNAYIDNSSIGVDVDKEVAYQKALSEAIERVLASYSDLISKVFSSLDCENKTLLLIYQEYKESDKILGNTYWTLDKQKSCFLPEYITNYPTIGYYQYDSNSSGMATHLSLAQAQQAALLELIERDAFLFSWLTKSPKVKKIQHKELELMGINIDKSEFSFHFFVLDSFVPIPTILMVMEKDGKSCISLATDFNLKNALLKAYQEGVNSKPLFEKSAVNSYQGVMGHVFYYLNPQNQEKLDWIYQSEYADMQDLVYTINTFDELIRRFTEKEIDIFFYEYNNKFNQLFDRKTVRCYSEVFLPIYFGKRIPNYIRNHPRIKDYILNEDMHPLG